MVTCILGNYFSPQNFTVYSRVFLIPHPGVLISMFGLGIIFLLSSKAYVWGGVVLTGSVVSYKDGDMAQTSLSSFSGFSTPYIYILS